MDVMGQDRIGYAGMGDLTYCILIPHTPRQVTRLLEDLVVATGLPARAILVEDETTTTLVVSSQ